MRRLRKELINESYRWQFFDGELRQLKIDSSHYIDVHVIVVINYIVYNIAICISAERNKIIQPKYQRITDQYFFMKDRISCHFSIKIIYSYYYFAAIPIILFITQVISHNYLHLFCINVLSFMYKIMYFLLFDKIIFF